MFFLFLFCSVTDADDSAGAAPITVRTGIEKETIYIGDKVTYYIEVETGKDVEVSLPGFGENLEEFSIKDFGSKELIEKNDYLQKVYYGKEILNDLEKQLKKNNALKKTLSDKEKKEALLKLARYYIDLLSEE